MHRTLYKTLTERNPVWLCNVADHLPGHRALSEQSLLKNCNPLFQFFQPGEETKKKQQKTRPNTHVQTQIDSQAACAWMSSGAYALSAGTSW